MGTNQRWPAVRWEEDDTRRLRRPVVPCIRVEYIDAQGKVYDFVARFDDGEDLKSFAEKARNIAIALREKHQEELRKR